MSKSTKSLIFFISLLFSNSLFAQINASEDYKKILEVFSSGRTYSVKMVVSYFFPADSSAPLDTSILNYCGNGKDFYYSLKDFEMINCEGMHIEIDRENKMIFVRNNQPSLPQWSQKQFFDMIDSLGGGKPQVAQFEKNIRQMNFEFPGTTTPKVSINYDDKNFYITECSLLYAQKIDNETFKPLEFARVKIDYKQLTFLKSFPLEKYGIKNYVIKKDDKYFPSTNYSRFEILNQSE